MTPLARLALIAGALLLALGTALAAYGSHGLAATAPATTAAFRTAVAYQLYQGLGLLASAWLLDRVPAARGVGLFPVLLLVGVLLFSGGIVVPILGGPGWLGRGVPAGGLLMIAGWLWFAVCAWRTPAARGPLR